MNPVCLTVFGHPIYWYGVMVALGFLLVILYWMYVAHKEQRPAGYASDIGFWIMLGGIIGARIAYVIADLQDYIHSPLSIFHHLFYC